MNEIWLPAKKYENYFIVSNTGKILSKRTNKELKLNLTGNGYLGFTTRLAGRNSKAINIKIHRLVAETFIKNDKNLPEVNHIDGNKQNNNFSNLEWVSSSENKIHAYKLGLKKPLKGENNGMSILTTEDVSKIRKLYIPGKFGKRKIATLLNLSVDAVDGVIRNKSWKE